MDTQTRLRALPKIDEALKDPRIVEGLESAPRSIVLDALRFAIDQERARILSGDHEVDVDGIMSVALAHIALKNQPSLRRVINATGVIVHTNLGRSILSPAASVSSPAPTRRWRSTTTPPPSCSASRRLPAVARPS
jgi:L-seryl-tRNA(Ser) seleniumtransferase